MRRKGFRLSDQAFASFVDIGAWTAETFGPLQSERYRDKLIARCEAIAAGEVPHRSCRAAFAADLREDLRVARAGQHFVIFLDREDEVVIVDFLHQAADVSGRLG